MSEPFPHIVGPDGQPRYLACLPARDDFGGLPKFAAANTLIPRSQWLDVDLSPLAGDVWDQGQHGCHDDETEVLTDKGWSLWSDYQPGTPIGTMNPISGILEFQMPSALHAYDYDGPMYYSDNRSLDFALTPNHRMYVRPWNEKLKTLDPNYRFQEIGKLGWYAGLPHSTTGFLGITLQDVQVDDGPIMSGDDFLAMVAMVVSDGWAGGTENTKNRVSFCCFKPDRYPHAAAIAARLGFHEGEKRKGVWTKSDPSLAQWFRQNAYTGTGLGAGRKMIPAVVKTVCVRQIKHFLEFFGDKHDDNRGARHFYSSSDRMIDDIQELLLRVGSRSGIYRREARDTTMADGREIHAENCRPEIALNEWSKENLSLERKKHLAHDRYKGTVFCATVPNSTIVTRRNGKMLISGNSCVGHGSAKAFEIAYRIAGGTMPASGFSPTSLYALINGGRDAGAVVSDAMDALIRYGLCTMAEVPESIIYESQIPASAKATRQRFRVSDAFHCETFDAIGSALQLGYPVSFGITIRSGFNSPGADGLISTGGYVLGGHCMNVYGCVKLSSGAWGFRVRNSWGVRWGNQGNCILTEGHFPGQTDAFAVRSDMSDPQDPNPAPVAT